MINTCEISKILQLILLLCICSRIYEIRQVNLQPEINELISKYIKLISKYEF